MGQIGRFIDTACAHNPEAMQKVLEREWGPLGYYVQDNCGCLVGSMAITIGHGKGTLPEEYDDIFPELFGTEQACHMGNAVDLVSQRWQRKQWHRGLSTTADARTTNMLKRRIRRALARLNRPEDTMHFAPKPEHVGGRHPTPA